MKNAISIRKRKPAAVSFAANDDDFLLGLKELKDSSPSIYDHILRQAEKSGANIVISLPAHRICPSGWYNRHPDSFKGKKFEDLKNCIQLSGINTQPIIVRPCAQTTNEIGFENEAPDEPLYEIISGHLMHQACRELCISVRAIVIPHISDQELTKLMHDENRSRPDFSPWEAGVMFKQWIQRGLYSIPADIVKATGRDPSDVSRFIALANLPAVIVEAFQSPLVLQMKDADKLKQLLNVNKTAVLKRAVELAELPKKKSRTEVLSFLKC